MFNLCMSTLFLTPKLSFGVFTSWWQLSDAIALPLACVRLHVVPPCARAARAAYMATLLLLARAARPEARYAWSLAQSAARGSPPLRAPTRRGLRWVAYTPFLLWVLQCDSRYWARCGFTACVMGQADAANVEPSPHRVPLLGQASHTQ